MKNHKLSKILKLANDLTKQELMMLNQAVVSLIKIQQDVDFKKAAIDFKKGDIVSFKDSSGARVGVFNELCQGHNLLTKFDTIWKVNIQLRNG